MRIVADRIKKISIPIMVFRLFGTLKYVALIAGTCCAVFGDVKGDSTVNSILEAVQPGALVSFTVRETEGEKIVYGYQSKLHLAPASTQKLFTTWVALDLLGADRRWATRLGHTGQVTDGTLRGDIIIEGGGDPAFASRFFGQKFTAETIFRNFTNVLTKQGIVKIEGCIYGDGSAVENFVNPSALWKDVANYYGGVTSGLCYLDNRYRLYFTGKNKPGAATEILRTTPPFVGIRAFHNSVERGPEKSSDNAYLFGSFLGDERWVEGTYPAGRDTFYIQGSLPHPSWTCAREFEAFLRARGIETSPSGDSAGIQYRADPRTAIGRGPGDEKKAVQILAEHLSPSLGRLIRHINAHSDNNYADQLVCLLGKEKGGGGTRAEGLKVVSGYLARAGIDPSQYKFKDGSGLSHYNWISGEAMTLLLARVQKKPGFTVFKSSMVGGNPGDNLSRFGSGFEGKLWIKTGTLEGVFALAGYFKGVSGKMHSFYLSIMQHRVSPSKLRPLAGQLIKDLIKRN